MKKLERVLRYPSEKGKLGLYKPQLNHVSGFAEFYADDKSLLFGKSYRLGAFLASTICHFGKSTFSKEKIHH